MQPDEKTSAQLDPPSEPLELASTGRRAAAFGLELVLLVGTLVIGWLVWSVFEWRHGRTPAKRLLRLRVVDAYSGEPAGLSLMARRQAVFGWGVVGLFGAATLGLGWLIAAAFALSPCRQAMWDRLAFTNVVTAGSSRS